MSVVSSRGNDPSRKPFAVGAWVKAEAASGVIAAHGGESHGYSLFLYDGIPHFTVCVDGAQRTIFADQSVAGQWRHVAAVVDAQGEAVLYLDGEPAGRPQKVGLISARPKEGLDLGADSGTTAGAYVGPLPWNGLLEDVRVYWGPLSEETLTDWAR